MDRVSRMRIFAVVLLAGTSFMAVAAQSTFAVEPVAIAQTTSAVSSKAFLGTPAPDVLTAPASPTLAGSSTTPAPVHSGVLDPVVGAALLIFLVLAAGLVFLSRRRRARQATRA